MIDTDQDRRMDAHEALMRRAQCTQCARYAVAVETEPKLVVEYVREILKLRKDQLITAALENDSPVLVELGLCIQAEVDGLGTESFWRNFEKFKRNHGATYREYATNAEMCRAEANPHGQAS